MFDYIKDVIGWLQQFPEVIAVVLGTIGSWSFAAILEVFMPLRWDQRRQKQATILANIFVGTILSAVIWSGIDPKEVPQLNYGVSIVVGLTSPFTYPILSRILGHWFPWFSAWTPPKP